MVSDRNALGDRGEAIFYVAATKFHGDRPLFRPILLGGKWPIADAAVELVDQPGMFFLVQVKSSARGFSTDGSRLRIAADRTDLQMLADAPLPTYLIGVDEPGENVFLAAVHGRIRKGRTSISTKHSLQSSDVRQRLFEKVKTFWQAIKLRHAWSKSQFMDEES
jgi:hypothetical protein